jgi:CSLREA domain-containing protein
MKRSTFLLGIFLLVTATLHMASSAHAATFTVSSTTDAVDAAPGDGVCAAATGACTLRAAIEETNALAGPDGISLPAGIYALTIAELRNTSDLIVSGDGPATTIIDGGGLHRVFVNLVGATLGITDVTIRNGNTEEFGGGVRNTGSLSLSNSTLSGNTARHGGALLHESISSRSVVS